MVLDSRFFGLEGRRTSTRTSRRVKKERERGTGNLTDRNQKREIKNSDKGKILFNNIFLFLSRTKI